MVEKKNCLFRIYHEIAQKLGKQQVIGLKEAFKIIRFNLLPLAHLKNSLDFSPLPGSLNQNYVALLVYLSNTPNITYVIYNQDEDKIHHVKSILDWLRKLRHLLRPYHWLIKTECMLKQLHHVQFISQKGLLIFNY